VDVMDVRFQLRDCIALSFTFGGTSPHPALEILRVGMDGNNVRSTY